MTDTSAFEKKVSSQGYDIIVRRDLPPLEGLDDHAHDYDVWGLITKGEFRITMNDETRSYREGDEFQLDAACPHSESAGEGGASLVIGRRTR